MNNSSLKTLKAVYAKAQEMGRTHVRFNESGDWAAYYQNSAKNGAYSLQEIQDRIIDLECPLEAVVFEDDEMPTDKEFGELGFKFATGDVVIRASSGFAYTVGYNPDKFDKNAKGSYLVKSLVPRKNMGVQPCGDDSLVNVHFDTLSTSTNEADCYGWDFIGSDDITHWIPSKENFIKPQPAKLPETQVMEQGFKIESLQNDIKRLEALLADEKANHERTKSALAHKQDILDILQSTINLFQYK